MTTDLKLVNSEGALMSKPMIEFQDAITAVCDTATDPDIAQVDAMLAHKGTQRVTLTPAQAAWLFVTYSKKNRPFSLAKAYGYRDAMRRGEWKFHHQGLAIYPDGSLADGQHRTAGCALSGVSIEVLVTSDFDEASIDAIDRATRRSAGEALEMVGVEQGKLKAAVAKTVMAYQFEVDHGNSPKPYSDPQIEKHVIANDEMLTAAITIGLQSTENVSDACLGVAEASSIAYLMMRGGWSPVHISGYVASIQQGIAAYPEAPTLVLARLFIKSKASDRGRDRLTKKEKLALALKGAVIWNEGKSVARLSWVAAKETLPTYLMPDTSAAISA